MHHCLPESFQNYPGKVQAQVDPVTFKGLADVISNGSEEEVF